MRLFSKIIKMAREVLNSQSRKLVLNVLEYFQNKKETSTENISAINCAAEALKISSRTISRIRQEERDGIKPKFTRNKKAPKTRELPETVKCEIRNVIYTMIQNRQFVTRKSLQTELKKKAMLEISKATLSKILKGINFGYKKDNGRRFLIEKPEIAAKRVTFLRGYENNKKCDNPLDVVFLDETWIFQHGSNTKQTWHDNNVESVWNKTNSDGKRYIVVHAGNKQGFIDGAGLIFSTKNKSADYHDNMTSELFEKWMAEQLLPRLERPSLIVMDNAKYHSRLVEKIPNSLSTKEEIILWLRTKNIEYPSYALKRELLAIIANHRPKQMPYAVDILIEKMGHSVLRLPPYHCQFNAIELIWANCKQFYNTNIGRDGYNDVAVLNMWEQALKNVTTQNWQECIRHTEDIISEFWEREKIIDNEVLPLIINVDDNSSSDDPFSSDSESDI